MTAAHGVIVLALGVVVVMLRQKNGPSKLNGAGDLYRRIESAEQRLTAKMDSVLQALKERGKR